MPVVFYYSVIHGSGLFICLKKGVTKLVPRALLSYISTCELLRTLEKCLEKHEPQVSASHTSQVFLKVHKCLYNSTMHSARFLFLY